MSSIPKDTKSKYNKDNKFSWVDSQWEKFMTEQKELKSTIENLENEIEQLKQDHYFSMRNKDLEIFTIREQMRQLVERVPSKYLTKGDIDG
tara:strand:- start:619 stop:891 length:273 start_codon:yes stop_codon:yes gene_type:complete